jgi:[ribosomal protein S18]-alanine N-acetyltransferase
VKLLALAHADFESLALLHACAFDPPWSAASLRELAGGPGGFGYLAGAPENPEGFVLARLAADEAEVLTLVVSPGSRRRGLGRALIEACGAHAARLGGCAMFLEVDASNAPARSHYERLGFTEVGKRTAYYRPSRGPAVDAVLLRSGLPLRMGKVPQSE